MEGLADQYKTYSDNPGLNAECPSLNSLEFVQGEKSAIAAPLKVLLFCAKFDKGGGPVITQFSKLKEQLPEVPFVAVFTDPQKSDIQRFFDKKEFKLTFPAAFDDKKEVQNLFKGLLKVGALPIPYAFVVKDNKIVWLQVFSQNHQLHNSNFAAQLKTVIAGGALESNGPAPVPESSSDEEVEKKGDGAGGDDEMSLF